jgi:hypothetical protein
MVNISKLCGLYTAGRLNIIHVGIFLFIIITVNYNFLFAVTHPTFVPLQKSPCDQVFLDHVNVSKTLHVFAVHTWATDPRVTSTNTILFSSHQETRQASVEQLGSTIAVHPLSVHLQNKAPTKITYG